MDPSTYFAPFDLDLGREYPYPIAPPPITPAAAGELPAFSVNTKTLGVQTNESVKSYVLDHGYEENWVRGYAEGFPLFVNTVRRSRGPTVLTASIPVLNYFLERGARLWYQWHHSEHPQLREEAEREYKDGVHLWGETPTVSDVLKAWNFYGIILNKDSEGAAEDWPLVHCVVQKRARVTNLWGNVQEGDCLYLRLTPVPIQDIVSKSPDGKLLHYSTGPDFILQVTPVVYPLSCRRPTHLGESTALDDYSIYALDYVQPSIYKNRRTVKYRVDFTESYTKESAIVEHVVQEDETENINHEWQYGGLFPIGTVLSTPTEIPEHGTTYGRHTFEVLRDQQLMAHLEPKITMLVGVL